MSLEKSRIEETIARHDRKFNCAQAVACTYCDLVGMDEEAMFRVTEGLGAGMGNMNGTCGAVTGACIIAGLLNSDGNLADPKTKGKTYRLSADILKKFKERNGSVICRELKGVDTGKVLRACPDCIRDAAEFVEEMLSKD